MFYLLANFGIHQGPAKMESGLSSGTSFGRKKRIEVAIGAAATGLLLLGMKAANILRKGEVNYEKINFHCVYFSGDLIPSRCNRCFGPDF